MARKKVLITGASKGLGRELALLLAEKNFEIILLARTEGRLKDVTQKIVSIGGVAFYYVCDIRDNEAVTSTTQKILKDHHAIDILINNAGIWTDDELESAKPDRRRDALETNILGQIQVTEAVLPSMKANNDGKIFFVISTAAAIGIPAGDNTLWKTYGASKWGLMGYTQALKESLRDTNIQVTQFLPGGFESDLYENAGKPNAHGQLWMMNTKDVAELVLFALTRPDDVYIEQLIVSKQIRK